VLLNFVYFEAGAEDKAVFADWYAEDVTFDEKEMKKFYSKNLPVKLNFYNLYMHSN
jgi:hypothetical protein